MKKKIGYLLMAVGLVFALSACSSATAQPEQTQSQQQNQPGQAPDSTPIEGMLAMGTLNLEGSENAVTAEQAKELLPLWKAVRTLSSSDTTAADEMTALYQQIEESMTAQQVQAIKDMRLSPEDTQALMQKYGVQAQAPQIDPDRLATRQASAGQAQGGSTGGGFQGGGPGGGMGMGGFQGAVPPDGVTGGGAFPGGQMPNVQGTPQAGRTPRAGGFRGGMNSLFVEPLIKLLEERTGA